MKKSLLLLMLFIGVTVSAQTTVDLSGLTSDITLGEDCSSSETPEAFITTGDANLNTFKVTLRNSTLRVNGNINGPGRITACGNSNSEMCLTGSVQNNPNLNGVTIVDCNTLNIDTFVSVNEIPKNLNYIVYNTLGQVISKGNTTNLDLPRNVIFLLKVEGFKTKKLWLQ